MIFDISDSEFKHIFRDKRLHLPITWDGVDFQSTLDELFYHYIKDVEYLSNAGKKRVKHIQVNVKSIERVCGLLKRSVSHYLNGFPAKAYRTFGLVMTVLMDKPLRVYQKSIMEQFDVVGYPDEEELKLFRAVRVDGARTYARSRVFHTPYNMRSKVSTTRYSIAGYPSLYLGTSLELCCEEMHFDYKTDLALASIFKLERSFANSNINIRVIELGVKPQDFIDEEGANEWKDNIQRAGRRISPYLLNSEKVREAYLMWYPLIAACSFIRANRKDPFAAEYIIPQLLMQWVRNEMGRRKNKYYEELIGIRYFSCASVKASDMGFNYVFPTSGKQISEELPFCSVLARAFLLTKPEYISKHISIGVCEKWLRKATDYDCIGSDFGGAL